MDRPLHIGVMGAGSVGCYVGGKLLAASAAEVVLVGRERMQAELAEHGLWLKDFDDEPLHVEPDRIRYETDSAALVECDAVLVSVKSAQTADVARQLATILKPDALVASLQNGIGNAGVLREQLTPRQVLGGIVGFNVVSRGGGLFHRAMSGPLMFEACAEATDLMQALAATGLSVEERTDLAPDQWTKLMVNLNNAVSALSDAPTRELLLSPAYRRIIAALISEALAVLRAANIRPAKLRGVPIAIMPFVLRLPTPIVRLVTGAQLRVDPDARSSMWEDLTRGRPTEVDYLNGEIVRLAERVGGRAPLNARIVTLVHRAEAAGGGSPKLSGDALWQQLNATD